MTLKYVLYFTKPFYLKYLIGPLLQPYIHSVIKICEVYNLNFILFIVPLFLYCYFLKNKVRHEEPCKVTLEIWTLFLK